MKQMCVKCGLEWNVSDLAVIPCSGYICPPCRRDKQEKEGGERNERRVRHMGSGGKKT